MHNAGAELPGTAYCANTHDHALPSWSGRTHHRNQVALDLQRRHKLRLGLGGLGRHQQHLLRNAELPDTATGSNTHQHTVSYRSDRHCDGNQYANSLQRLNKLRMDMEFVEPDQQHLCCAHVQRRCQWLGGLGHRLQLHRDHPECC